MNQVRRSPCRQRSACQSLAHFARLRPTAIAVVHRDLRATYSSLAAHVLTVADTLRAAGIRPGQIVGVETGDRYQHLLIVLAAEALGVTTLSLALAELGPPADLELLCDRIIVTRALAVTAPEKLLTIPPGWLARILDQPAKPGRLVELEREADSDFVVRLIKSSGTTGVPKVMGMTHRVLLRLNEKSASEAPSWVLSNPVYLCLYNFSVRASHARAMLTLQFGGTIHLTGADVLWDLITAGIGNHMVFVTGDLERFVRGVPHGRGPFGLFIDVIGAAVPPRIRRQVSEKLTEHLMVTYGSNEVNRVSRVDEDNIGTLFPEVRVRIVDEQGGPVPMGQPGLIRVRTDTMTQGYVNAPELTRAAFVDGWFNTSDLGFQPSKGQLVVLGRSDDMLIIGGLKIAPGPIEERLTAIDGIGDALVTGVDDQMETLVLLVAVELEAGADPAALAAFVSRLVREQVTSFELVLFDRFPRTETGKVRREAVRALYRERRQLL